MESRKVIIKRSEWGTGKKGGSLLNRGTGLKCCLGFICEQAFDIEPDDLVGHSYVPYGWNYQSKNPLNVDYNNLYIQAADINDADDISDAEREKRLMALFADSAFELEFVD